MNAVTNEPRTPAAADATATAAPTASPHATPILNRDAAGASAPAARPGRPLVGGLTLAAVALLIALDLLTAERINPFTVPPPAAFGSGLATTGAHCAVPN